MRGELGNIQLLHDGQVPAGGLSVSGRKSTSFFVNRGSVNEKDVTQNGLMIIPTVLVEMEKKA